MFTRYVITTFLLSILISDHRAAATTLEPDLPLPAGSLDTTQCPEGPPLQWEQRLDAASKALLAPIVFNGKLISLSEDYGGRLAATYRVLKQLKNIGSVPGTVPVNLLIGTQVTLYYATGNRPAGQPPYCAARLNATQVDHLRPEGKYIVYAASPLTSLIELHRTQLRRQLQATFESQSGGLVWPPPSAPIGHQLQQLQQLYANYLSSFSAPEPLSKRTSRALRKTLCPRCGKCRRRSCCLVCSPFYTLAQTTTQTLTSSHKFA